MEAHKMTLDTNTVEDKPDERMAEVHVTFNAPFGIGEQSAQINMHVKPANLRRLMAFLDEIAE